MYLFADSVVSLSSFLPVILTGSIPAVESHRASRCLCYKIMYTLGTRSLYCAWPSSAWFLLIDLLVHLSRVDFTAVFQCRSELVDVTQIGLLSRVVMATGEGNHLVRGRGQTRLIQATRRIHLIDNSEKFSFLFFVIWPAF